MDKLIHTALNSIAQIRGAQIANAQNLANQTVPGFRRDIMPEGQAFVLEDQGVLQSRAFQIPEEHAAFSDIAGFINQTDEPLDLALADKGWFYVQPDEGGGGPALTRRGDMRVTAEGALVNGAGEAVLNQQLQPITLPPFRSIMINELGAITIEPIGGAPGERVQVATLATTRGDGLTLIKGLDGQIRPPPGTALPAPDQGSKVVQGALEGSNVNATEELISSIELQRSFELNIRMISTAKEIDEAGSRLLRMPES